MFSKIRFLHRHGTFLLTFLLTLKQNVDTNMGFFFLMSLLTFVCEHYNIPSSGDDTIFPALKPLQTVFYAHQHIHICHCSVNVDDDKRRCRPCKTLQPPPPKRRFRVLYFTGEPPSSRTPSVLVRACTAHFQSYQHGHAYDPHGCVQHPDLVDILGEFQPHFHAVFGFVRNPEQPFELGRDHDDSGGRRESARDRHRHKLDDEPWGQHETGTICISRFGRVPDFPPPSWNSDTTLDTWQHLPFVHEHGIFFHFPAGSRPLKTQSPNRRNSIRFYFDLKRHCTFIFRFYFIHRYFFFFYPSFSRIKPLKCLANVDCIVHWPQFDVLMEFFIFSKPPTFLKFHPFAATLIYPFNGNNIDSHIRLQTKSCKYSGLDLVFTN